jgi:hypothetical protein
MLKELSLLSVRLEPADRMRSRMAPSEISIPLRWAPRDGLAPVTASAEGLIVPLHSPTRLASPTEQPANNQAMAIQDIEKVRTRMDA